MPRLGTSVNRKQHRKHRMLRDFVVQTPGTAHAVEIKRRKLIGREVETEVEENIRRLKVRRGISVRPVLVYDGELYPQLSGSGYFAAILDAATLIGK